MLPISSSSIFVNKNSFNVGRYRSPLTVTVQRCQIAIPRWSNDISSAGDNAISKNRAQNIERSFGCGACSAVLLKPNIANILLFSFCKQKFVQHGPITIAIDCNGLSLLIFEEKWSSGPKSTSNSDSFWVRRLFNASVWVFCAPNATILLVYIPAKIEMNFIWKDDFFAKIGIFCKSIAGPLSEAKTQPYSFGGRIKLIIRQISHLLSVTYVHNWSFQPFSQDYWPSFSHQLCWVC